MKYCFDEGATEEGKREARRKSRILIKPHLEWDKRLGRWVATYGDWCSFGDTPVSAYRASIGNPRR